MHPPLLAYAGIMLMSVGMMLIVAGVITAGLFLPGAVLILLSMIVFGIAGILAVLPRGVRTP